MHSSPMSWECTPRPQSQIITSTSEEKNSLTLEACSNKIVYNAFENSASSNEENIWNDDDIIEEDYNGEDPEPVVNSSIQPLEEADQQLNDIPENESNEEDESLLNASKICQIDPEESHPTFSSNVLEQNEEINIFNKQDNDNNHGIELNEKHTEDPEILQEDGAVETVDCDITSNLAEYLLMKKSLLRNFLFQGFCCHKTCIAKISS